MAKFILLLLHAAIFNYAFGAGTAEGVLSSVDDDIEATIGRPCAASTPKLVGTDTIRSSDSSSLVDPHYLDVTPELDSLTIGNPFKQKTSDWACVLYSFLNAIIQTPKLKDQLSIVIRKDDLGNYYVNNLKISKEDITAPKNLRMHPSDLSIVRALGRYAEKQIAKEIYLGNESLLENYVLTDFDGKDLFFHQPVKWVEYRDWNDDAVTKLELNGDLTVRTVTYTGDFVLSLGRSGHAYAIYYDKVHGKWQFYDNQSSGAVEITATNRRMISTGPGNPVIIVGDAKVKGS
ncbi:MAG: hypothetical protein WCJ92_07860 [Alphaproteobacteria bacterium]